MKKVKQKIVRSRKKIFAICTGALALTWFLIRVIPKPSRAAYPCQRIAFPVASGFVIWLAGVISSLFLMKKSRKAFSGLQEKKAWLFLLSALLIFSATLVYFPGNGTILGANDTSFIPTDSVNSPMGTARGIFPGRVAWSHEPAATSWEGKNGYWWQDRYTNQQLVDSMFSACLQGLTGQHEDSLAWNRLFQHFNKKKHGLERGYQENEKIAVKLNLNTSNSQDGYFTTQLNSSPHVVLSLVIQLVEKGGVAPGMISLYDASRFIPKSIRDKVKANYPQVKFGDIRGDGNKIFKCQADSNCKMAWSQELSLEEGGGHPTYLPECVSGASYIINLGNLKGHDLTGVTICAKNHVGTIISTNPGQPTLSSPRAAGFHPYATVHRFDYWNFDARPMGTYNTLVDLMGHEDLGEKTLLFIVDALYASRNQYEELGTANKWQMPPFNDDWTSSLFMSQDGVALESVGLDFLRSEPTLKEVYGKVDNYLHEASQANDPPSGTFYDPEGDGTRLPSLGVHEHWNDAVDKQYSRNLGTGEGIELVKVKLKNQIILPVAAPANLCIISLPNGHKLSWKDLSENESYFVIEKSLNDSLHYETLDSVEAGITEYLIEKTDTGVHYFFRIKAGNSDTASTYSNQASLYLEPVYLGLAHVNTVKIYPNPAHDRLTLSTRGENIQSVSLLDINGKKMKKWPVYQGKKTNLSLSGIAPGTYILSIKTTKRHVHKQLIVK